MLKYYNTLRESSPWTIKMFARGSTHTCYDVRSNKGPTFHKSLQSKPGLLHSY